MFSNYYQVDKVYALRRVDYRDTKEILTVKRSNRRHLPYLDWSKNSQVYTIEETYRYIAEKNLEWQKGSEYTYEILENGKVIGDFQIRPKRNMKAIELGYWIDFRRRLQGITSLLVNFMTLHVTQSIGYHTVVIIANKSNLPSVNLALKLEFKLIKDEINEYNNVSGLLTFIKEVH